MKRTLLILIVALTNCLCGADAVAATKPNFILIFTDDQGYQDVGCFGSPNIKTPNLDQMAAEGRKFTSFYSACSVCSPSRAALLTGCYPPRTGVTKVLFPRDTIGLNSGEVTIAEMLKAQGYATTCIGKWHLGHRPQFLPTRQGFDSYFGIPYSNDMKIDPNTRLAANVQFREGMTEDQIRGKTEKEMPKNKVPLMRNEEVIEFPCDQTSLTKRYTEEAIDFIKTNKDQPFFIYLPHTMPHIPLFVSESFSGKSEAGLYGDTIEELDWSVGQILQTLKDQGIDENTLVVFTSDNGPWKLKSGHGGSALPLKGYKFGTYEGGMRVPCIMRWPGKIPAGTTTDEVASTIDLAPTFAKRAAARLPRDRVIDGHDLYPLMTSADAKSPHEAYLYYKGNRVSGIRSGKWKLNLVPAKLKKNIPAAHQLHDLSADISEATNVAQQHPDVVERMLTLAKEYDQRLKANSRPVGMVGTLPQ